MATETYRVSYQAAQRIRASGVHGVLIGRVEFWQSLALIRDREQLKKLLKDGINPTPEDLPEAAPTSREERLLMALEHALRPREAQGGEPLCRVTQTHRAGTWVIFAALKGCAMKWSRINSLADVERIIMTALEEQNEEGKDQPVTSQEEMQNAELDLTCAC